MTDYNDFQKAVDRLSLEAAPGQSIEARFADIGKIIAALKAACGFLGSKKEEIQELLDWLKKNAPEKLQPMVQFIEQVIRFMQLACKLLGWIS